MEKENRDDDEDDNGDEIILYESARSDEGLSHEWQLYSGTLKERFELGNDVGHDREDGSNQENHDDERIGECSFYFGLEFLGVAELCGETLERALYGSGLFSGLDDGDFSSIKSTWELLHRDAETVPGFHEDEEIQYLCLKLRIFILVEERSERRDNRYSSINHIGEVLVEEGFLFRRDSMPKVNLFYLRTYYLIVHSD